METNTPDKVQLLRIVADAAAYCTLVEGADEMEKTELAADIADSLVTLYADFSRNDLPCLEEELPFFPTHIDEDYYESIRRRLEMAFGADDTFLETFEEDMKYSDSPIAVSLSEILADIYQDVYDFVSVVRESDGEQLDTAFLNCRESFISIWSQKLCNALRQLNHLRYSTPEE